MKAPSIAGSYLYDVKYNGSTVCAGSVDIVNPLTCSVSPTTVDKGESFIFRADKLSSVGNCWSCYYIDAAGSTVWNQSVGSDITLTATTTGINTLKFVCTCDNVESTCSSELMVNQTAPKFTCPTSAKASIGASDNVKLALTGVTGCDDGCDYSISGDGNISVSGNSYTGGTLPVFTDNTVTSEDSKSYTVRLTNSAGSVEHTCSVEFTEGSSSTCTCDANCDNLNTATYNNWESSPSYCFYRTSKPSYINSSGACVIKVNGVAISVGLVKDYADASEYYIELTGSSCWANIP